MKKVLKNVRSIRLGLRIQLSALVLVPLIAVSFLLSMSIYRQNEANILSEIVRFSGAILKGGYGHAFKYLSNDRTVRNSRRAKMKEQLTEFHRKKRAEGLEDLISYFPAIISRESLLDQAFLINVNEKGSTGIISDAADTRFIYFRRNRAGVTEYAKSDAVLNSLYLAFMNSVTLDSRLVYADAAPDESASQQSPDALPAQAKSAAIATTGKYVVVGVPVFNDRDAEKLYSDYAGFIAAMSGAKIKENKSEDFDEVRTGFESSFLQRLVDNYTDIDYKIDIKNDDALNDLYAYLVHYHFNVGRLSAAQKQFLKDEFISLSKAAGGKYSISYYLEISSLLQQKYNMPQQNDIVWVRKHLFDYLDRKDIRTSSPLEFGDLALTAYRSDLDGILGVYLLRSEFYENQRTKGREIVNMALALFLRCAILALFLPGVLIKKINLLAAGAYEIGRGNFEHSIAMKGSDELGRLADIFNIMGKNLKRARDEIVDKHRMEDELKTASEIQSILLPERLPETSQLSFAAHYEAQSEAGGDYYDIIELDDGRFVFTVADVSGHGVGAGLVMTMTRTLVHCLAPATPLKEILRKLNDHLYRNTAHKYFVTMFYGIYEPSTQKLSFANAGHTPVILIRGSKVEPLEAPGVALGAIYDSMYANLIQSKSLQLKSGDTLVLYTDGIVEAMNENMQEYGDERFADILKNNALKSTEEMKSAILSDLKKHTGKVLQSDDMTLLLIRIH